MYYIIMKKILNTFVLLAVLIFPAMFFSGCAATSKVDKKKDEVITVTYNGEIIKIKKAPKDVYLTLDGGKFNMSDPSYPTFEVSVQAMHRITKVFDKKIGYVIVEKSGKEANMSEELYQAVKKQVDRSNNYLRNLKY